MKIIRVDNKLSDSLKKELLCDIDKGNVIGISTDTIFGLAFDFNNEKACEKIKNIKQRENELFSFHVGSFEQILQCDIEFDSNIIEYMKRYLPGPVTFIIPGNYNGVVNFYGIRFPDNPVCNDFFSLKAFPSLVATSCNLSGMPSLIDEEEIIDFLEGKVNYVVFDSKKRSENIASTIIKIDEDYNITCIREGVVGFEEFNDNIKIY